MGAENRPDSVKTFVAFECSTRLASSASIVVRLAVAATIVIATERTSFVVKSSAINHITMVSHNLNFVGTFLNFFANFYFINY